MSDRKEYFKKYREEHREIINKKARETYYKNKEECPEYEKQRRREWSNNKRKKDKENAELVIKYKEVLDKIKEKGVMYYDPEYSKIYGELCSLPGANNTRTPVIVIDDEILELLELSEEIE